MQRGKKKQNRGAVIVLKDKRKYHSCLTTQQIRMMNRLCENVVFVDLFDLRVFDMLDPEFVRLKESRVQFNDRGKWKDSKEDVILFLEDVFQTDLVPLIGDGRNT